MIKGKKLGLGGGCHWCTEAVFQSLKGVTQVEQGYIASDAPNDSFSEAVLVHYEPAVIPIEILIEIHLYTHRSTSNHSFRNRYRSAVYTFDSHDAAVALGALEKFQEDFEEKIITQVLPFREFEASRESLQDYYLKDPDKPFCEKYIHPKLDLLRRKFSLNFKDLTAGNS